MVATEETTERITATTCDDCNGLRIDASGFACSTCGGSGTVPMTELAKAPTAYEVASQSYSNIPQPETREAVALHWMIQALHQELADEREIVRAQGEQISALVDRANALEYDRNLDHTAISWLQERVHGIEQAVFEPTAARTVEVGTQQPTMRMRLQHSHTLKEGHRLSETTVEWAGVGEPDEAAIEKALITAFHLGQREANLRNAPQPADDEDDPS